MIMHTHIPHVSKVFNRMAHSTEKSTDLHMFHLFNVEPDGEIQNVREFSSLRHYLHLLFPFFQRDPFLHKRESYNTEKKRVGKKESLTC
jgi:hypothetical protein